MYQHRMNGEPVELPPGKIICVGRNYAAHAKELNNPVPTAPILFIKPATSARAMSEGVVFPKNQGACHHELEMSVLIGKSLTAASEREAENAIVGFGLALDLTLRDVQSRLKEQGHPWEIAKSFDGACPLSEFVAADLLMDPQNTFLELQINGEVRQQGNTADMITPLYALIAHMSQHFSLMPGDVVLTGTPAGVGPLHSGDRLQARLGKILQCETTVN